MTFIETALPFAASQFNASFEVNRLKTNPAAKEAIQDNILHALAEFVYQVPIVNYQYLQTTDNKLIFPSLAEEGDVLSSFYQGIRPDSPRSLKEYQGFSRLREQILETHSPSVAMWASPPGPAEEGYKDYGFIYLALIPQYYEGFARKIQMLALRVNDFDDKIVKAAEKMFKQLGPNASPSETSNTNDLLLNPITVPIGKDQPIKDIYQLFSQIAISLKKDLDSSLIEDGLNNKTLGKIRQKVKSELMDIYSKLWSAAKGIPVSLNTEKLFRAFPVELFFSGSCPSASSSAEKETSKNPGLRGKHWCPICGEFFNGRKCGCGYTIDEDHSHS
jgi:hypothetical protein